MTGLTTDLLFTLFSSHYLDRKYTVYQFSFGSDEYSTCTCISSLSRFVVPLYEAFLHVLSMNTWRDHAVINAIKFDIHVDIRQA